VNSINGDGPDHFTNGLLFIEGWNDDSYFHNGMRAIDYWMLDVRCSMFIF
jgi:hypothetical protein